MALCRKCHAREHGLVAQEMFFLYRDDQRFNRICHRLSALSHALFMGRSLRERDYRFLAHVRNYDPAITFQVDMILRTPKL